MNPVIYIRSGRSLSESKVDDGLILPYIFGYRLIWFQSDLELLPDARQSWMVSRDPSELETARRFGFKTLLIGETLDPEAALYQADNFEEAAGVIILHDVLCKPARRLQPVNAVLI